MRVFKRPLSSARVKAAIEGARGRMLAGVEVCVCCETNQKRSVCAASIGTFTESATLVLTWTNAHIHSARIDTVKCYNHVFSVKAYYLPLLWEQSFQVPNSVSEHTEALEWKGIIYNIIVVCISKLGKTYRNKRVQLRHPLLTCSWL